MTVPARVELGGCLFGGRSADRLNLEARLGWRLAILKSQLLLGSISVYQHPVVRQIPIYGTSEMLAILQSVLN